MIRDRVTLLLLLFTTTFVNAQSLGNSEVLSIADQMPEYPGGMDSLIREVSAKIVYPKACRDSNVQGKVYIRFVVNEDGSISNIEAKAPHPLLKAASIDAVKTIGKFKPGMDKGKVVKVWYNVPLNFRIEAPLILPTETGQSSPANSTANKVAVDDYIEKLDAAGKITREKRTGIFVTPEVSPRCAFGDEFLLEYIWKTIQYPQWEQRQHIGGKVIARFVVDETGKISNIKIIQSVSQGIDDEMVRVMGILPKFYPGKYHGEAVKAYYLISCDFDYIRSTSSGAGLKQGYGLFPGSGIEILNSVFVAASLKPSIWDYYAGGLNAFEKLMQDSLEYPPNDLALKMEANILVRCKINDNLKLIPIKALNDFDKNFTNEAFRLIDKAAPFQKGIKEGDSRAQEEVITIKFRIPNAHINEDLDLKLSNASYETGVSSFKNESYGKALNEFTDAIKASSTNADAYFNRAITKLKLNDTSSACDDFKRAYLLGELDALNGIQKTCK